MPDNREEIMETAPAFVTVLAVVGVVLLMLLFVWHYLGPSTSAWVRANREEKIGLSKNKLFSPNGYLIHSGSEIQLGSSGSFKRFESVDREYSPQCGNPVSPLTLWDSKITDTDIPPQPLRPAPSPTLKSLKEKKFHLDEQAAEPEMKQQQQSIELQSVSAPLASRIIPRPIPKKQMSAPVNGSQPFILAGPPDSNIQKHQLQKQQTAPKTCTNPFLNGAMRKQNQFSVENERSSTSNGLTSKNPFLEEEEEHVFTFEPSTIQSLMDFEETELNSTTETDAEELVTSTSTVNRKVLLNGFSPNKVDNGCSNAGSLSNGGEVKPENSRHPNHLESTSSDAGSSLTRQLRKLRQRSRSETEASEISSCIETAAKEDWFVATQTFTSELAQTELANDEAVDSSENQVTSYAEQVGKLHKTVSETYITQYSNGRSGMVKAIPNTYNNKNSKILVRQGSFCRSYTKNGSMENGINSAVSCESLNSQSSVCISDLEQPLLSITGSLCIGLQYDKNTLTEAGQELYLTVLEAKELVGPSPCETDKMDTFVRIYLVPDETNALQTKTFRDSLCPSYQESFSFWIDKKPIKRSLWFHLYHTSTKAHTLIGEAEMPISMEIPRPITTWLTLSDSRHKNCIWGELMFSLSYLPTAERLTVVVVKVRNLRATEEKELQNIFVKVYLLKNDKKVSKKKTSIKRGDKSQIFNEAIIFSVPPYKLNSIQIRLTVVNVRDELSMNGRKQVTLYPLGHLIVGSGTSGKGLRHWHQMLTSMRKPVAMWHPLRRISSSRPHKSSNLLDLT